MTPLSAVSGAVLVIAAGVAADQATFRSRAEAVRVDVSVTARGRPVLGLAAADFEIYDNGVRQHAVLVDTAETPLDLVLALDLSGSVSGERLSELRAASETALGLLTARDRAAVLTFSDRVELRAALTDERARLHASLDARAERGRTSLVDAAYAALLHADGGAGRALVIMLSDGIDTGSWLRAADVIETARRLDVVMFGVSAGAPPRNALDDLADASGGDVMRLESTRELSAALSSLMRDFRRRYLLSYTPTGVASGGWHSLEVRVKGRGRSVKARKGYFSS